MKRAICVIFAFIFAAAFVCGCGKSNKEQEKKFEFPDSAQEEYERAYTVNGGKAYDFALLKTFTRKQTVSIYSPDLAEKTKSAYPTAESRVYVYDARDGIKSQITVISATFSADITAAPTYTYYRKAFVNNCLCEPWFSQGVQSDNPVEPIATFADYNEYIQSGRAFDTQLQNITAYPPNNFVEVKGGTSDGQYIITAQVQSGHYDGFFELLAAEYDFRPWYASGEDGSKLYNCFLDPMFIKQINVTVVTEEYGVKKVTVTVTAAPAPEPYFGLEQDVTVTFDTEYSSAEFPESTISVNIKE